MRLSRTTFIRHSASQQGPTHWLYLPPIHHNTQLRMVTRKAQLTEKQIHICFPSLVVDGFLRMISRLDTPGLYYAFASAYIINPIKASLSTMSDRIVFIILFTLVPIALIAAVAFALLKLLIPLWWTLPEERLAASRPVRNPLRALSALAADSWPDLERFTPDRKEVRAGGSHQLRSSTDTSSLESPSKIWKPPRQSRLDWTFSSRPYRHL